MHHYKKHITILLSLTVTPLILFISTSNALFSKNQVLFGHNYKVLYPFALFFLLSVAFGYAAYYFFKYTTSQYILWFYLAAGLSYLIYTLLRNAPIAFLERPMGVLLSLVVVGIILTVLARKIRVESSMNFFAVVSVCLMVAEAYVFFAHFQAPQSRNDYSTRLSSQDTENERKLPNIYFLILDEFQTDMFDLTLSNEVKSSLGGFTYFPENTALFGRTGMSLPSIFSGKRYDFNVPQIEYKKKSVSSKSSILYWLKDAGYAIFAYIRGAADKPSDLSLFDLVFTSEDQERPASYERIAPVFRDLWVYKNLPLCASIRILGARRLEQVRADNFLPENANIRSVNCFRQYLQEEEQLPAFNRFSYIYLLLPHFPYIYSDDCSYAEHEVYQGLIVTSPLEQSKCATKLMIEFIETLKSLGRFENALIIVCSDHGSRFAAEDGRLKSLSELGQDSLEWNLARARALLLIKPVDATDANELIISDYESSLIDIAPTIAKSVLPGIPMDFDGIALVDPIPSPSARQKYYYFFDKKGPDGWTDEMVRYIIDGNQIKNDGIAKIKNNRR